WPNTYAAASSRSFSDRYICTLFRWSCQEGTGKLFVQWGVRSLEWEGARGYKLPAMRSTGGASGTRSPRVAIYMRSYVTYILRPHFVSYQRGRTWTTHR